MIFQNIFLSLCKDTNNFSIMQAQDKKSFQIKKNLPQTSPEALKFYERGLKFATMDGFY